MIVVNLFGVFHYLMNTLRVAPLFIFSMLYPRLRALRLMPSCMRYT